MCCLLCEIYRNTASKNKNITDSWSFTLPSPISLPRWLLSWIWCFSFLCMLYIFSSYVAFINNIRALCGMFVSFYKWYTCASSVTRLFNSLFLRFISVDSSMCSPLTVILVFHCVPLSQLPHCPVVNIQAAYSFPPIWMLRRTTLYLWIHVRGDLQGNYTRVDFLASKDCVIDTSRVWVFPVVELFIGTFLEADCQLLLVSKRDKLFTSLCY